MNLLDKLVMKGVIISYEARDLGTGDEQGYWAMAYKNGECFSDYGNTLKDAQANVAVALMLKVLDERQEEEDGTKTITEGEPYHESL